VLALLLAACRAPGAGRPALSPSEPVAAGAAGTPAGPLLAPGQQSGDLRAWLVSTPPQPASGNAQIEMVIAGTDGQPVEGARVTYDTDMTNMSHGLYEVQAEPVAPGRYGARVHFSMPGPWRIIASVERPGQPPVRLRFEFGVKIR